MENNWNSLPNEILDQIIQALGSEDRTEGDEKTKWMTVNKQCYDWYQSIKYKEVTIKHLKLSNNIILNNILFSNFQPGKWIKSITSEGLTAPSHYNNEPIPPNNDSLYLLMTYCPTVKHATLPAIMDNEPCEKQWDYFYSTHKHQQMEFAYFICWILFTFGS